MCIRDRTRERRNDSLSFAVSALSEDYDMMLDVSYCGELVLGVLVSLAHAQKFLRICFP